MPAVRGTSRMDGARWTFRGVEGLMWWDEICVVQEIKKQ